MLEDTFALADDLTVAADLVPFAAAFDEVFFALVAADFEAVLALLTAFTAVVFGLVVLADLLTVGFLLVVFVFALVVVVDLAMRTVYHTVTRGGYPYLILESMLLLASASAGAPTQSKFLIAVP